MPLSAYFLRVFLESPVSSTALRSGTSAIPKVYQTVPDFGRLCNTFYYCPLTSELAMLGELPADQTWGWSQFSSQPVDAQILPGNHTTILKEPHVQVLAETLKFCLEQVSS